METNKFEQLKNKAKEISLTHKEKAVLRSNIESFMKYHPIQSTAPRDARVKSPFSPFMLFARSVAFVLIGMLAGGSGLAYASERALPGDTLYPLKVEVVEEVVATLSLSDEAKLEWETKRIIRRIDEIQKVESTLTKESDTELAYKSLDESLDRFETKATRLQNTRHSSLVLKATANIEQKFKDQNEKVSDEEMSVVLTSTMEAKTVPVETKTVRAISQKEIFTKGHTMTQRIRDDYSRIEEGRVQETKPIETEEKDTLDVSIEQDISNEQIDTGVQIKTRALNNL
jgi:hypothetical protein